MTALESSRPRSIREAGSESFNAANSATADGGTHIVWLGLPLALWHTATVVAEQTPPDGQPPPWPVISLDARTTVRESTEADANTRLAATWTVLDLSDSRSCLPELWLA